MKNHLLLAGALSTTLLVGCAAAPDDDATRSDEAALTTWSALVRCEGAVVDVESAEHHHVQVVVSDPHAVHWLSAHPGSGGAGRANAKGEVILTGWTTSPVNVAADFTGVVQYGYAEEDALRAQARVTREAGGLKVRLVAFAHGREEETANWFFHC